MNRIVFGFLIFFLTLSANAQESPSPDNTDVFTSEQVDNLSEFPGGIEAFGKIVAMNFRIPEIKKGQTKIVTSFIIEKDGSLSDVRVVNKVDEKMGAEAIRVIMSVKQRWTPAMKNGSAVRSIYSFPIRINIP